MHQIHVVQMLHPQTNLQQRQQHRHLGSSSTARSNAECGGEQAGHEACTQQLPSRGAVRTLFPAGQWQLARCTTNKAPHYPQATPLPTKHPTTHTHLVQLSRPGAEELATHDGLGQRASVAVLHHKQRLVEPACAQARIPWMAVGRLFGGSSACPREDPPVAGRVTAAGAAPPTSVPPNASKPSQHSCAGMAHMAAVAHPGSTSACPNSASSAVVAAGFVTEFAARAPGPLPGNVPRAERAAAPLALVLTPMLLELEEACSAQDSGVGSAAGSAFSGSSSARPWLFGGASSLTHMTASL